MKTLFTALSLLALLVAGTNAYAHHDGDGGDGDGDGGPAWGWHHNPGGPGFPPPPPGWGPGYGPGWGPGYPPPPPPPPGWGPGHGPGWGPGYPPPPPPPPQRTQYVECGSSEYRFNRCVVSGAVRGARLVQQESSSSCNLGQSWGYDQNSVWVNEGCRGTFLVYLY